MLVQAQDTPVNVMYDVMGNTNFTALSKSSYMAISLKSEGYSGGSRGGGGGGGGGSEPSSALEIIVSELRYLSPSMPSS